MRLTRSEARSALTCRIEMRGLMRPAPEPETTLHGMDAHKLQSVAARHLELIRVRPSHAGVRLDETSWAILLDLFAHMGNRDLSLSKASICTTAPQTTALRRIYGLVASGLVRKVPDRDDLRRFFLILTPDGYKLVGQWLQQADS